MNMKDKREKNLVNKEDDINVGMVWMRLGRLRPLGRLGRLVGPQMWLGRLLVRTGFRPKATNH
jgi:hypothetical protein